MIAFLFKFSIYHIKRFICLFGLILYVPVKNLSVMLGRVFLGWISTKQGLICLAQGHNVVTTVGLEPAAVRSLVKHSTTEPLRSLGCSFQLYTTLTNFSTKYLVICKVFTDVGGID